MNQTDALKSVTAAMHQMFALGHRYAQLADQWDTGLFYCDTDEQRAAHVRYCNRRLAEATLEKASKRRRAA